ncbi:MAG TPA: hypothetical protein VLJ68_00665 [Chitinophagaceae bacterium]|nr:hypothetical protein [Chitinophagaceae bacterium]
MARLPLHIVLLLFVSCILFSCRSMKDFSNFSTKFFNENEEKLGKIQEQYKKLNPERPFSIVFLDRQFNTFSLEINSDTFRYIYKFLVNEPRLLDTLDKFRFNTIEVMNLISSMREMHCNWVNKLEYYPHKTRNHVIYLSIRNPNLRSFLKRERYLSIIYFDEVQSHDAEGVLLHSPSDKDPGEINGQVFWRLRDKVYYTLASYFR